MMQQRALHRNTGTSTWSPFAAYLGVVAGANQDVHLDGDPALGLAGPLLKLSQLTAKNLE